MSPVRLLEDSEGATIVEFALIAPVFFLLLLGFIECGLLLRAQHALQNAVTMAARCANVDAALCGSVGALQSYAAQQALGLDPPLSTFAVSSAACGTRISANYTVQSFVGFFGNVSLNAEACFPK